MKGLKKIALVAAVAAAPFAANAEMQALNDASMGAVTGQAGVTIDLSANVTIGEIAYEDQGFLAFSDVSLSGQGGTDLDDIRLTIDVAGDTTNQDLGTAALGATYLAGAGFDVSGANETAQAVTDGDLVIGLRSQSGLPVDFNLSVGEIFLSKSGSTVGALQSRANGGTGGTTLVSALSIDGFLGPIDIVINEESNSLNVNAYFSAEGSLTMPFMGTSLDFELHNRRGATVSGTLAGTDYSFAHAQVDVSVVDSHNAGTVTAPNNISALRVNVQDFSGDLDLTNINTGGTESIGNVYMTDLAVRADMVIYGH
ncbi:DUF6160 family protein [Marinobacter similis]|uniref:DUF6160 domain-containing protein n=1 Tax=Marinobacter similis TaxID=1420916 RepID=W5YLI6_9GAMM|nr:DUF6160 family protein [Marinobacter similis]AHI29931.1 hypothetical protein AU14_01350 [Marinobacter similis]MBX2825431.1 hypothetical protein [Gammaproteobacteria bacterium]